MQIDVFTLFPGVLQPYLDASILERAISRKLMEVNLYDIRSWAPDRHHTTDDTPYGGGGGMVMKPEPVFAAVEEVLGIPTKCPLILMTPQGRVLKQSLCKELARVPRLMFICGHYEGVDERIAAHLCDDELSIGDYVLTGGELPAMVTVDALVRLIPGVLREGSAEQES
ncbi:MAG: tRNA (guanosine(37)-N1)-methyltransferase TrmD, partial [Anaerolineaceae bacterium]|nr:tRNA (guanosine(37)-N1)-methyltransferase TrmD [Anaerolineaceae bacterium]